MSHAKNHVVIIMSGLDQCYRLIKVTKHLWENFSKKNCFGLNFGDFRNQSRKQLGTLTFIEGEAFVVKAVVVSLSEGPFIQKGKL